MREKGLRPSEEVESGTRTPLSPNMPDIVVLPKDFGEGPFAIRVWVYGRNRTDTGMPYPVQEIDIRLGAKEIIVKALEEVQREITNIGSRYELKDGAELLSEWIKKEIRGIEDSHEFSLAEKYGAKLVYRLEGYAGEGKDWRDIRKENLERIAKEVYEGLSKDGIWQYFYKVKSSAQRSLGALTGEETKIAFENTSLIRLDEKNALFAISIFDGSLDRDLSLGTLQAVQSRVEHLRKRIREVEGNKAFTWTMPTVTVPKGLRGMVIAKPEIGAEGGGIRIIESDEVEKDGDFAFVIEIPASILAVVMGVESLGVFTACARTFSGKTGAGSVKLKEEALFHYSEYFKVFLHNDREEVKVEVVEGDKKDDYETVLSEESIEEVEKVISSWTENSKNKKAISYAYDGKATSSDVKSRILRFIRDLPWIEATEAAEKEVIALCLKGRKVEVYERLDLAMKNLSFLKGFDKMVEKSRGKRITAIEDIARLATKWVLETLIAEKAGEKLFSKVLISRGTDSQYISFSRTSKEELRLKISLLRPKKVLTDEGMKQAESDVKLSVKTRETTIYEEDASKADILTTELRYHIETVERV